MLKHFIKNEFYLVIKTAPMVDPDRMIYKKLLTAAATLGLTPKYIKLGILSKPAPFPISPVSKPEMTETKDIFKKFVQFRINAFLSN